MKQNNKQISDDGEVHNFAKEWKKCLQTNLNDLNAFGIVYLTGDKSTGIIIMIMALLALYPIMK